MSPPAAPDVHDVAVVGAGPAGAAATITASRAGLRTALIDRAEFPRDKTCGDGLTAAALRELSALDVDVRTLESWTPVRETVVTGPDGRQIVLPLPDDGIHAGVVTRMALDNALAERAMEAATTARMSDALTALDVGHHPGDPVTLTLASTETLRARFVVAADGHWSSVRRCLGEEPIGLHTSWHAVRHYYRDVADRRLHVVFDADLLPGYAWVFPLAGGGANVGFGVLRRGRKGRDLKELAATLHERPALAQILGPAARPLGPVRAWPISGHFDSGRVVAHASPRVLFAGDAAGAADPMTGEGIAQALETGRWAAEAIALSGETSTAARHYRNRVRRDLGVDLRFASALQRVLVSSRATRLALKTVELSDWTRRNFARWMWEDYPRAILVTPSRWRRGMLTPPYALSDAETAA